MSSIAMELLKNGVIVSVLTSIVCGVVGTLVYSNRLTFMSGGIAHAAYGGIGLGIFLGTDIMFTVLIFTITVATMMGLLTLKDRGKIDSVVGLIWAGGMSFGILLLDITPGYHVDVMSYLFGSIVIVSRETILLMFFLSLFTLVVVGVGYNKFLAVSFDHEFASTRGINVTALYLLIVILVAICVVMLIQVVGIILVIALLSIPPYLSSFTAKTMKSMMFCSFLWSMISCAVGIGISYYLDVSSGASIVSVSVVLGSLFLGVKKFFSGYRI